MACQICIAQRIALGWVFKLVHFQQFTFPLGSPATGLRRWGVDGAKMTQFELLHEIARLNARHALN
jgi:hypothetical protein